jgi:hypothetical protein
MATFTELTLRVEEVPDPVDVVVAASFPQAPVELAPDRCLSRGVRRLVERDLGA